MSRGCILSLSMVMAMLACDGERPRRAPFPPFLGKRTDAAIASFRASCDEKFAPADRFGAPPLARFSMNHSDTRTDALQLRCEMSNLTGYRLIFFLDNVKSVHIDAPTEEDRLAVFERVFAPLLPDDVREPMRRSISDPDSFRFDAPTGYGRVRLDTSRTMPESISWTAE